MAISDQLLSISNTKAAIKTSIENKGVTVGSVPFADYPSKIDAISGGGPTPPTPTPWTRPSEWTAIPNVTAEDNIAYILFAIYPDSNFLALSATVSTSNYNVDWGDGTNDNVASGSTASHQYDYTNPNLSALTSYGYKMALVKIIPNNVSATFTTLDLSVSHTNQNIGAARFWLDIIIGKVTSTVKVLMNTISGGAPLLERFVWKGGPSAQTILYSSGTFYRCVSLMVLEWPFLAAIEGITLFQNCVSIQEIPSLNFNPLSTNSLTNTFNGCRSLISVGAITISGSRTDIDMSSFFNGCTSLYTSPSITFTGTAKATTGNNLFTACSSLTNVTLFDTSGVTVASNMFSDCASLTSIPAFNFTNNTTFAGMFSGCVSLVTAPTLNYIASKVTNMSSMFSGCIRLTSVPNYDTSYVTLIQSIFNNCGALVTAPSFNTVAVTNMTSMFAGCTSLLNVPVYNISAVTSMTTMFQNCLELKTIGGFTGTNTTLTTVTSMFSGCQSLISIPSFGITGASINNMASFVAGCGCLKTIGAFVLNSVASSANGPSFVTTNSLQRNEMSGFRFTHSYANNNLSATALNEIYTKLGNASSQTITVTGNWGVAGDDPTIATNKGWTVTG